MPKSVEQFFLDCHEELVFAAEAELAARTYRLNKHLLAYGEKPDMRPWGGLFDAKEATHA